jgi:phage FluMu protein Com
MAIIVTCTCGQKFSAKDSLAGMRVRCPKCKGVFAVPRPREENLESSGGLNLDELVAMERSAPAANDPRPKKTHDPASDLVSVASISLPDWSVSKESLIDYAGAPLAGSVTRYEILRDPKGGSTDGLSASVAQALAMQRKVVLRITSTTARGQTSRQDIDLAPLTTVACRWDRPKGGDTSYTAFLIEKLDDGRHVSGNGTFLCFPDEATLVAFGQMVCTNTHLKFGELGTSTVPLRR